MKILLNKWRGLLALLALAVLVGGCIPPWTLVDAQSRIAENDAFSVEMPIGWMWNRQIGGMYSVTRDGKPYYMYVNRVWLSRDGSNLGFIDAVRFNAEDAFPYLKKPYKDGMLPSEAAELFIANLKIAGLENLTVVQNTPKKIAGRNGFEVHVQFRNSKGLQFERVANAFGDKTGFYVITYQAPSLHYFPLHRDAYRGLVGSLKLKANKPAGA